MSITDTWVAETGSYGINTNAGGVVMNRSTVSGSGSSNVNTNAGPVTLTNSTIAGPSEYGINTNAGVITIGSSTVVGPYTSAALSSSATAVITNSIVTGGSGVDTCDLPVTSVGFNLSDDDGCSFGQTTDLPETDPQLGPLAENGGWTPTFLPQGGSPAIDTGGDCPAEDQRGEPRPADGNEDGVDRCDRGSVEVQPPTPPAPAVLTPTFTG